jgi:hypothetical protein
LSLLLALQITTVDAAPDATNDWVTSREVLRVSITVPDSAIASLRTEPRKSVHAVVREGAHEYDDVALHLKGSIGSFRPIDEKPALTLSFSKFESNRMFHGNTKVHFNNSVEDPSYLNEKLGTLVFTRAGIACPLVRHAIVELNGRRLGLYVVKEGFSREFLARHFKDASGVLYDTDADPMGSGDLDQTNPAIPTDDLKKLADAARFADPAERWHGLQRVVDLDEFISFMAVEIMICHRDGYSIARNNYRIYHDPSTNRFEFLPHGMDQLFGRPDFPWLPSTAGMVSRAVMATPEGKREYVERFRSYLTNIFDVTELTREIDQTSAALLPVLSRSEGKQFKAATEDLKRRVAQRKAFLDAEANRPEPMPVRFTDGVARLTNWFAWDIPDGGFLKEAKAPDKTPSLHIHAGPMTAASWRTKVLLEHGSYRFEARARTDEVRPLPYGKNKGLRLRINGERGKEAEGLTGTSPWQPVSVEFSVRSAMEEKELVCELRATKGDAWFDRESLRLVQLP